jgi:hypothetical protein
MKTPGNVIINSPFEAPRRHWQPLRDGTLTLAEGRRPASYDDIGEALKASYFRPQCPHCSHRQGGRVNKIVITATKEVVSTGMTTTSKRGRKIRVQKYRR